MVTPRKGLDHLLDLAPDQMLATLEPHQTASDGQHRPGVRASSPLVEPARREPPMAAAGTGPHLNRCCRWPALKADHWLGEGSMSGAGAVFPPGARLQPVRRGCCRSITRQGWAPRWAIARKMGFRGRSWLRLVVIRENHHSAPSCPVGLGLGGSGASTRFRLRAVAASAGESHGPDQATAR